MPDGLIWGGLKRDGIAVGEAGDAGGYDFGNAAGLEMVGLRFGMRPVDVGGIANIPVNKSGTGEGEGLGRPVGMPLDMLKEKGARPGTERARGDIDVDRARMERGKVKTEGAEVGNLKGDGTPGEAGIAALSRGNTVSLNDNAGNDFRRRHDKKKESKSWREY